MKKTLFFLLAMPLLFGIAFSARALSLEPLQNIKPIDTTKVIFDPTIVPLIPIVTTTDPIIKLPLQPIELPEIKIPPELLEGPSITNIQMSSDGAMLLVQWQTDRTATSKVEYGDSSAYVKALEDKELIMEHAMAIPAKPGTLHVQISSVDSLKRESKSGDLVVMVPKPAQTTTPPDANGTTAPAASTTPPLPELLDEDALTQDMEEPGDVELPARVPTRQEAEVQNTATPVTSPITATNAALGGVALLLAGVLIGVLVRQSKKEKED